MKPVPSPPPQAAALVGPALPALETYAAWLAGPGVVRGLIGPREVDRLWDRHLLNCAVLAPLLPDASTCADVGSGAGLPGVVLALMRPDVRVTLVEPALRRTTALTEIVAELGLMERVEVRRARAEESPPAEFDTVTARAVAPLARLAGWCLPMLRPGGELLALKGSRGADEMSEAETDLRRLGAVSWRVEMLGHGSLDQPTSVVRVVAGAPATASGARGRGQSPRR